MLRDPYRDNWGTLIGSDRMVFSTARDSSRTTVGFLILFLGLAGLVYLIADFTKSHSNWPRSGPILFIFWLLVAFAALGTIFGAALLFGWHAVLLDRKKLRVIRSWGFRIPTLKGSIPISSRWRPVDEASVAVITRARRGGGRAGPVHYAYPISLRMAEKKRFHSRHRLTQVTQDGILTYHPQGVHLAMPKRSKNRTFYEFLETPTYGISETSHYLRVPAATVRAWVFGTTYRTPSGRKSFQPLLAPANRNTRLLTFVNLLEVHILDAIRRVHRIPMQKVRKALQYLKRYIPSSHPLVDQEFETDGLQLFVRQSAALVSITEDGQTAMREALRQYLRRIERDPRGLPVRLYPYTRKREFQEPRAVAIDPRISFGRPVIAGTGVATAVVAERYKAGESIKELADDYGLQTLQIEEAIRCELKVEVA